MKIIYYSLTGNITRFLNRAGVDAVPLTDVGDVCEPYILVTGTFGFGEVPQPVADFLMKHHSYLRGVAASGNKNFGQNFARAGDTIAAQYNVPLLMKFELHGNEGDSILFKKKVADLDEDSRRKKVQSY
ncbi:class Ib ribonucleoside-diphosphate reductase assembly flavoprotein NrdI [Macrococcus equipercicus]|uniref:Protein NrdI n=1 Tax=Macrococcus equipercicus TaxID=69967 RepID=A0A9Q9BTW1_9STAP|nr:class Ib ribonucleoside-diphosphate reductase assembly flavoprotein NrdI [Macrococcus equipercicus]UTH14319.1 class Ib ribonucleoside-diphosphate reductase assembly flavoprotein NrdI [Macrococcus equipercicus]